MNLKKDYREVKKPAVLKRGKHCPFVDSPWNECYVVGTDSLSADKAIYYCGRNFEECKTYWKRIVQKPT